MPLRPLHYPDHLISRRPYALNPHDLTWTQDPTPDAPGTATIPAFWYRRTHGVPTVHLGHLTARIPAREALDFVTFRAYCHAKTGALTVDHLWDMPPDIPCAELVPSAPYIVLREALATYVATPKSPMIPPGFDGWWTLHPAP